MSGVDVKIGDEVSRIMYECARKTWENRRGLLGEVIIPFDDFSGLRAIDVSSLPPGSIMNFGFDGIGTKAEIAERVGDHSTIAYDLFAMVCDDAVIRGGEPVLLGSILDFRSLGSGKDNYLDCVKQLAQGYVAAAKRANVAVINGEVAELGKRVGGYGPFNYNWGAGVVWFAKKDRLLTGHSIRPGDYLVGLREDGFRSNGLSLLRKSMEKVGGYDWHEGDGREFALSALLPSTIYTPAIVDMFGGFNNEPRATIHGAAHITGGGVPGKLGRALKPSGLGATIINSFNPCDMMLFCQSEADISDEEAYGTWNMGQGMIVITPEPKGVMDVARCHGIESKVMGLVETRPGIRIVSNGFYKNGTALSFG